MDIRQIEFFVALAEQLNFTRAAEQTHVSQSGLSSSIRSLERELRHPLFDRTPRAVGLTPAGHAFLPRARRILADAKAVQQELADARETTTGTLDIGAEQCLGDVVDLLDVLTDYRTRHSGVTMRFEQMGGLSILDRLAQGKVDVGLLAQPGGLSPQLLAQGVTSFEVARDAFELIAAADHPAASADLGWASFETYPFVDLGTGWTARRIVDDAFGRRRLVRRTAFSVDDVHLLLDLVRSGAGVALVPASYAAKPHADGLVRRPVPDADLSWVVHCATRAEAGRPARLFADMLMTADAVEALRSGLGDGDRRGSAAGPRTGREPAGALDPPG